MTTAVDESDEILDLVNEHDEPVGTIARRDVLSLEQNRRGFVRGVGVFLTNKDGDVWIPRRSQHKKIAPGGLDFSAGEHVGHDETYKAAALRGMQEELRINADPQKLTLLGRIPPFPGVPYFHEIFTYPGNKTPLFNRDDFSDSAWIDVQTLADRLARGEPAKEMLKSAVKLLLQQNQPYGGTK